MALAAAQPKSYLGAILLAGFDDATSASLGRRLAEHAPVLCAEEMPQALALLEAHDVAVLCLGDTLHDRLALDFLVQVLERYPEAETRNVVLSAGPEAGLFQDLVDQDRLYYLTQKPPDLDDVEAILKSAASHCPTRAGGDDEIDLEDERTFGTARILELTAPLGQETSLGRVAALVARVVQQFMVVAGSRCLIYDPATETLWTPVPGAEEERRESAAAGLVSYVARTGSPVLLERIGDDPRFDPEADNDAGAADQRFLALPVTADDGRVLAVIRVLRDVAQPPFTAVEREHVEFLAKQTAPVLARLELQARLERRAAQRAGQPAGPQLFRQEAIDHHQRGAGDEGHLLELSPRWMPLAFRLLLLVCGTALLYVLLGRVNEYAPGPAVVRVEGRTDITANLAGTVTALEVAAGDRVRPGRLLARFYGAQEAAELERIRREFELGLISRLRNPSDPSAERALSALRAQKQLAETRLEQRSVRAPHAGVVSDLHIRPGQYLVPGQVILSLVEDRPALSIVALFPGHYRPMIEPGMPLRLELQGYRYAFQHLAVERIDEEVIGPTAARRVLGAGISDAVPINGPVIIVHAGLPSARFESDGETYAYHDGMPGLAEVRVRSEPILLTLWPSLKVLFADRHG